MAIILQNGFTQNAHHNNPADPRFLIFAPAVDSPFSLYSFANSEMNVLANVADTDVVFRVQDLGAQAKANTILEFRANHNEPFQNITNGPEIQDLQNVDFRITITANTRAAGMITPDDSDFTNHPEFRWHTAQLAVILLHEITFHAMDYIGMINTFKNWDAEPIADRPRLIDFHLAMRTENEQHGHLVGGAAFNPSYLLLNYKRARAIFQARCYQNMPAENAMVNHQDWQRFNTTIDLDCTPNIHHGPGIEFNNRWWRTEPTVQEATQPYYLPENVVVGATGLDWDTDNEETEDG